MKNDNCKKGIGESAGRCEADKSEKFRDGVEIANKNILENDPGGIDPGTNEDEVRMVNPDIESMESRG